MRLKIFDGEGKEISDDIKIRDKVKYPFVGGENSFYYKGKKIGFNMSGGIHLDKPYTYTETEEN